jgi:hypothetical protein
MCAGNGRALHLNSFTTPQPEAINPNKSNVELLLHNQFSKTKTFIKLTKKFEIILEK